MSQAWSNFALILAGACLLGFVGSAFCADDQPVTQEQLKELKRQNETLQQQLQNQQKLIDQLSQKVADVQNNSSRENDRSPSDASPARGLSSFGFGKIHLSGEGGVAFSHSGSKGAYPNSEFRVDEAKLFVEARVTQLHRGIT